MSSGNTVIFTGNAHPTLTQDIIERLGEQLGTMEVSQFSDEETKVSIDQSVRGKDVFVIQPTSFPANQHIMELLIMIDAIKRSGPKSITAIMPYFGYSRQDRKPEFSRVPITAALIPQLLSTAGVDTVVTMDLHAQQIQGFFDSQIVDITAKPLIINDIERSFNQQNVMIVSPDVGGVGRARSIAKNIGKGTTELAIIDKRRPEANQSEVMNIIGNVQGKICIMVDDIIDTAGTICKAADALFEKGALEVYAYCTHAVLSGNAVENINNSKLTSLIVTNTIPLNEKSTSCSKIKVLKTGTIFADTIRRLRSSDSVSQMYTD